MGFQTLPVRNDALDHGSDRVRCLGRYFPQADGITFATRSNELQRTAAVVFLGFLVTVSNHTGHG
ncbi:hypothetical protein [Bythopirellula polymerisocia]|uniref:hypothetical protein n=1 Tax=Bythopirellula polymerisocia TaxID=2528003 RepID=UPI001E5D8EEF|nr:hypothetical protein [Bythopirellula polymerisocia]